MKFHFVPILHKYLYIYILYINMYVSMNLYSCTVFGLIIETLKYKYSKIVQNSICRTLWATRVLLLFKKFIPEAFITKNKNI